MSITAGLDIGGAHLKVALVESGRVIEVEQFLCPLWQGMDKLDAALSSAQSLLAGAAHYAITMTGELSDLFADRKTGVAALVDRCTGEFGADARFWMGANGFGSSTQAKNNPVATGSTNFLATASAIGSHLADALLIDFGSTTADIIAIRGSRPAAIGLTDAERLATRELVYTGLTRTAVMGVTAEGIFKGQRQGLAREYLATMADVRRILGALPDGIDLHATADGRGKSQEESIARLARMFGRDAADGSVEDWRQAALVIADAQMATLAEGAANVMHSASLPEAAPIVTAGIGAEAAAALARHLGRTSQPFGGLVEAAPARRLAATQSAPAVAVALLLDGIPVARI